MGKSTEVKGPIIGNVLKYWLALQACLETMRYKKDIGIGSKKLVNKDIVISYLRGRLIKEDVLKPEMLVIAGRQERWLKAMEFALGIAHDYGWFVKEDGHWSTTEKFDKISKIKSDDFRATLLAHLVHQTSAAEQEELTEEEQVKLLGLRPIKLETVEDVAELLKMKKSKNFKIFVSM